MRQEYLSQTENKDETLDKPLLADSRSQKRGSHTCYVLIVGGILLFCAFVATWTSDDSSLEPTSVGTGEPRRFSDFEQEVGTTESQKWEKHCKDGDSFDIPGVGSAKFIKHIGSGESGFGVTCLANIDGKTDVIKVVLGSTSGETGKKACEKEASTLSQMQSIDGIVKCGGFGCTPKDITIGGDAASVYGMEEITGKSLAEDLQKDKNASRQKTLFLNALKKLKNMWKAGWVHGDCHPGNVMITTSPTTKVTIIDVDSANKPAADAFPAAWLHDIKTFCMFTTQDAGVVDARAWLEGYSEASANDVFKPDYWKDIPGLQGRSAYA